MSGNGNCHEDKVAKARVSPGIRNEAKAFGRKTIRGPDLAKGAWKEVRLEREVGLHDAVPLP